MVIDGMGKRILQEISGWLRGATDHHVAFCDAQKQPPGVAFQPIQRKWLIQGSSLGPDNRLVCGVDASDPPSFGNVAIISVVVFEDRRSAGSIVMCGGDHEDGHMAGSRSVLEGFWKVHRTRFNELFNKPTEYG